MKIDDLNNLTEGSYLVLLPDADYDIKDSVFYSFDNIIYLDHELTEEGANKIISFVNNKGSKLIVFDWNESYRIILPYISKKREVKSVYKNNLSQITNSGVRATFTRIMEFYDRNIITEIACLDESTSIVLEKAGYKTSYILLDVKTKERKKTKDKSIGLIGNDYNPNHNTYNQLSALKLIDYDYCKLVMDMPATRHFVEFFGINAKRVNTTEEALVDNEINLYCNFTFNTIELVLKSLDLGIPCLLGNNNIFDKYPKLKKYLVLESDDDIKEIADKINTIRENKDIILKEYEKFRKDYSKKSISTIEKFLDKKKDSDIKVTKVVVDSSNNDIKIEYMISSKLKEFFFLDNIFKIHYYNNISEVPKSVAIIPFVALVLPIISIMDATLELEELDEDFYNCLDDVKKSLNDMYPGCGFLNGKIICNKLIKNHPKEKKKVSMFYSGGVDSLSTLISIHEKKPYLITIWGSDIWLPDKEGWETATHINEKIADTFGLENYYIKSNFRNVINELALNDYFEAKIDDNWWHGVEHGLALLSHVAPLAYQYGIKTHYIPATYSSREKNVKCASYPTIDEKIKFCGCSIIHEGFDKNRQQKLTQICEYNKNSKKDLIIRACYMERGAKTNCCNCEKCYRTIMGIVAEKQNPRDYGFEISDEEIGNIENKLSLALKKNSKAKWHWKDVQSRCIENKDYIEKNKYYKWILTYTFD